MQHSPHDYAIEYLRQRLEQLDDEVKVSNAALQEAAANKVRAEANLARIDRQRQQITGSMNALRNAAQHDLLARPHTPQQPVFHITHKTETRVIAVSTEALPGGGHSDTYSEVTFCVPCGAGKPGSMRRPTDPCCMHRDQDDGVKYIRDDFGPAQPA